LKTATSAKILHDSRRYGGGSAPQADIPWIRLRFPVRA
jgi:hypothetical protein